MSTNRQRTRSWALGILLMTVLVTATTAVRADDDAVTTQAKKILQETGVRGGLIVHLGSGDGKLTAALRASDSYMVQGLDRSAANVQAARKRMIAAGGYGSVSVDVLQGKGLPYIDNLVNLVVAEDTGGISQTEIMRVLAPNGVAYIKQGGNWTKTVKPRPKNIDEWTHFMHDAGGNAVAHDDVVGPPRHLQWIGSPRWSRHHDRMASTSALVSAGGRIIYIMDEGSRVSIQLPAKWSVIARDAFNGTVLWKRRIEKWHDHLWPLKSGPTQLARRLVATKDRVYVTLGFEAPLTALDAATGETIRTYKGTKSTEEAILLDGVLYLVVNKGKFQLADFAVLNNTGDQRRVANEFHWNGKPREVMAIEADSGKLLWKQETPIAPISLTADTKRVVFHNGEKLVCLNRVTGVELWNAPAARRPNITMNFGPKVVIYQSVVLYAGGDRLMKAFSLETGKQLWSAPHAQSGYQSPEDLLVSGGLVWSASLTRSGDSGVFTGRDPFNGVVKTEFPPDVKTYWFHHRCYIAKATDKYLMPSRTGIEFVDPKTKHWDINHWVRGGCLYGVMPCNGLVYSPPHNCACYPEAKLFGLNALAPASSARKIPKKVSEKGRMEHGPAFGDEIVAAENGKDDWPTYRHDAARSGYTKSKVPTELKSAWESKLGGKLSTVVIAGGKLFVTQVDTHTVHALNAETGKPVWSYTAGGRVDSPPSIYQGRAIFGSADGFVYCVRASDGELIWRFRAAPQDVRLPSFEQMESVWPVHGNVMIQDDTAFFVSGRSNFLDGGLRFFRLDPRTGYKLTENILDETDPETKRNIQERLQTLNMPSGLPDILSSNGRQVFMRSQRFDMEGNRQQIGPHSGQPAEQGSVQAGEGMHIFSPSGYMDGTYFHRSYWVYGRSFAGGHAGYYQAAKFAPSGRLLVADEDHVYGFGRKPQYLKWTTTIEHQLFASAKDRPEVDPRLLRRGDSSQPMIRVAKSKTLDPTGKPLAVEAWIKVAKPNGVVLAHGGPTRGYALIVRNGQPRFTVRINEKIYSASAKGKVGNKWVHLVGALTADKKVQLYVNGKQTGSTQAPGLIAGDPAQGMEIGGDDQSAVGTYASPFSFTGIIDDVKVYHGTLTAAEIAKAYANPGKATETKAELILAQSFDKGNAADSSGKNNHGKVTGARQTEGKAGDAFRFTAKGGGNRGGGSFVKHDWATDLPLMVRAMVLADKSLFVAGPPDVIDEEEVLLRLANRDEGIQSNLTAQDDALNGKQGGILRAVSATDGKTLAEYKLKSLPVWDGMAAANGRLYLSTTDGTVICFGEK